MHSIPEASRNTRMSDHSRMDSRPSIDMKGGDSLLSQSFEMGGLEKFMTLIRSLFSISSTSALPSFSVSEIRGFTSSSVSHWHRQLIERDFDSTMAEFAVDCGASGPALSVRPGYIRNHNSW